ncbi:MAG: hypothetical protein WBQ95_12395, partial [Terracidiphilus sp.]
ADLILRKIPLTGTEPTAALEQVIRSAGEATPASAETPAALFKAEQVFLDEKKLVPLLVLPLACASGPRVRDLHLRADGTPDLADASLEDTR